jgi:hypothetical protein
MNIVEPKSWMCGPFTIHQRARFDSPAWAVYIVCLGEKQIGKQFSIPQLSDCEWLMHQRYADESRWREFSAGRPIKIARGDGGQFATYAASVTIAIRRGRKTTKADDDEREQPEALPS